MFGGLAFLHSRIDKIYTDNTFLNFYLMNHIPETGAIVRAGATGAGAPINVLVKQPPPTVFQELLLFQFSIDRELVSFSLKWL